MSGTLGGMSNIRTVTAFEKQHFDRTSSQVHPHTVDFVSLIGFALSDDEVLQLAGAPTGSTVSVSHKPSWAEPYEVPPPGVFFEIDNPTYIRSHNVVGVFVVDPDIPTYGLYLKMIDFHPTAPRRLAARMLAVMLRQARRIAGLSIFRLLAAGGRSWLDYDPQIGERWGGYYAWPRYGFDMPLMPETQNMHQHFSYYPASLSTCRTVRDVLSLKGGSEYWRVVGDGNVMEFDTSPSSASVQTLDKVLGEAGI